MFEDLNPLARSTAIIEIIIMLLVAFILGFILAWIIKKRKTVVNHQEDKATGDEIEKLNMAYKKLSSEKNSLLTTNNQLERELDECQQEKSVLSVLLNKKQHQQEGTSNADEIEKLNLAYKELSSEKSSLLTTNDQLERELDQCKKEKSALLALPNDNKEEDIQNQEASDIENAKKLGFITAKSDEKDDLTQIKGIGPFIEKKLNGLGIYTFEQIGAFTPETVEKVTEAIEFFPGRIARDNWVVQANELK